MIYNGVASLEQIANLDDIQLRWVYFRKRDENGALIRYEEETQRPIEKRNVGWEQMFKSVKRHQSELFKGTIINGELYKGLTEEEIELQWQNYLSANPGLVTYLNRLHRGQSLGA